MDKAANENFSVTITQPSAEDLEKIAREAIERLQKAASLEEIALLNEIPRFLTINYDVELEKLATFDTSSDHAAVFHLHGRVSESEPMILTEEDYRNLYLRETDSSRRRQRESLGLNSISVLSDWDLQNPKLSDTNDFWVALKLVNRSLEELSDTLMGLANASPRKRLETEK